MISIAPLLALALGAPPDIPPALDKIASAMSQVSTLRVTMRQEKEMAVFGEVLSARGELVLARPRRLMMDLTGAGGTRLVVNGDTMSVHYRALAKTETFNLSKDPRAKAVAEHLFLLLEANPQALAGTYTIEVTSERPLQVRLTPKPEGLRKVIAHVDARFDARGFVDTLVLHEGNGDRTRWFFDEPVLNAPIPDATFQVQPSTP